MNPWLYIFWLVISIFAFTFFMIFGELILKATIENIKKRKKENNEY